MYKCMVYGTQWVMMAKTTGETLVLLHYLSGILASNLSWHLELLLQVELFLQVELNKMDGRMTTAS